MAHQMAYTEMQSSVKDDVNPSPILEFKCTAL